MGCFINPFSEFQLYSYSRDGEIRLWDTQDGGCVKAVKVDGYSNFIEVIAHPTEPDCLFIAGVYKIDESIFANSLLTLRYKILACFHL